jgi:peptidyl-prolyl cis-trans isomerase D
MLKVFRQNLKYLSWILWLVIVVFIAFVFVDFGGGLSRDPKAPANYAAKVGSETVSVQEFQRQYRALEGQYRQIYGERFTPEIAQQMQLPLQALERAVSQRVLLLEAIRAGLVPSDQEVRRAILEIDAFKDPSGGFIGDREYAQILRENNQTTAGFERSLRDDLAVQKLTATLRQTVKVSEQDVERSYREQSERASIRYVLVPAARFASAAQVPEADVQAYFDAHPDEFRLPEQRVADYLLVDTGRLQQSMTVAAADAQAYYDAHVADYTREEEVRASHILLKVDDNRTAEQAERTLAAARTRIEQGADFAAVARELSEDPSNKDQGGDLGFFGRGRMIKAFEDAAFGAQPGQLVGPIRTDFGVHLIRVEERRPGGQQPFAEVQAQIENRLRAERSQTLAETKAKELRAQLAAAAPDAAKMQALAASNSASVTFETSPPFGRDELVPGIGRGTQFADAVFALETGKLAEPVRVPRGWAVAALREVRPPRVPPFAEVADKARAAAAAKRQRELATAALQKARADAQGGRTLDQIAQDLGVTVQDTSEFGSTGPIQGLGIAPAVAKAALALEAGSFGGPLETPQGAVLFQVRERKRFDPAEFAVSKEATRTELENQALAELLQTLIDRQRQELGVDYNRQLLEQWGVVVPGAEQVG